MSKLSSKKRRKKKLRKEMKEYSTLEIRSKLKYSVISKNGVVKSNVKKGKGFSAKDFETDHYLLRTKLRELCFKHKLIEHPENFPEAQQELRVYIVQNRKTYIDRLI